MKLDNDEAADSQTLKDTLSINGLHWRNDPWNAVESDFRRFALGKFDWVAMVCYPDLPPGLQARHLAVCRKLREINPRARFVVRLNLAGPTRASEFVAAFAPRLEELRELTSLFQIHHRPNHPDEFFGGPSAQSAWRYQWWHRRVVEGLKGAAPWARLGFPGLALSRREEAWLDICAPAIEMSDFIACHVYWQHDNWGSPDGGRRYLRLAKSFPGRDLYLTVHDDSTLGRSAEEKARIYGQWLTEVQSVSNASIRPKAACALAVSTSDQARPGFVLSEEACRILGDCFQDR